MGETALAAEQPGVPSTQRVETSGTEGDHCIDADPNGRVEGLAVEGL